MSGFETKLRDRLHMTTNLYFIFLFFCENSNFVKFLDLLVCFRNFYVFFKSWMKKNAVSNIRPDFR